MAKKSKKKANLLSGEKRNLDWHTFNVLENLLVFCALKERRVPKESGVHFRIGSKGRDGSICILFEIDRKNDPLIRATHTARPDYMVFYVNRGLCICTIVEMKGKGGKDLVHGIKQIKSFVDILKREMRDHLPYFSMRFQGILLTPPNSQTPLKMIEREKNNGFVILALQYHHKAELFPYISKENKVSERYKHEELPHDSNRGLIESILVDGALPARIADAFHASNFDAKKNRTGIYINYQLPDEGAYAVLMADNHRAVIAVKETKSNRLGEIRKRLAEIGISASKLEFANIA